MGIDDPGFSDCAMTPSPARKKSSSGAKRAAAAASGNSSSKKKGKGGRPAGAKNSIFNSHPTEEHGTADEARAAAKVRGGFDWRAATGSLQPGKEQVFGCIVLAFTSV